MRPRFCQARIRAPGFIIIWRLRTEYVQTPVGEQSPILVRAKLGGLFATFGLGGSDQRAVGCNIRSRHGGIPDVRNLTLWALVKALVVEVVLELAGESLATDFAHETLMAPQMLS